MNKLKDSKIYRICCSYIFPIILILYPLRHINIGLDFADTGYNYANFRYVGLEHTDALYFFSTYLANVAGHFLTLLPGGHTLLFMNLYTGLFVSILAFISYLFLAKRMEIPATLAFIGEFVAISICWCPTALLYNYMTYMLLLVGVILIYEGLTQDKEVYLIMAGVALGTNIFVRFSNIPEAGMIAAVWAYGIICRKKIKKVVRETGFCMLGYFGSVILWLGYISVRYGLASYVAGIKKLFAMTETVTDYKATSMLYGMFSGYIDGGYWLSRILVFLVPGVVLCFVLPKGWNWIKRLICVFFSVAAAVWLYRSGFCKFEFYSDGDIYRSGVLFLILAMFVCALRIFSGKTEKKEKLLAGMIILVSLITSIGSNNGLLIGINNLFLAVPYVLWAIYSFCRKADIRLFAVKAMVVMFLTLFLVQSIGFGVKFVFAKSEEYNAVDAKVENSDVLKGIYMSEEKADSMEEIIEYISDRRLTGKEVILYGKIPALSFYLEMPSSFHSWIDLESYSEDSLDTAIDQLKAEISEGEELPIVIFSSNLIVDMETNSAEDMKLSHIFDYMEEYGYMETFSNDMFVLYEAENTGDKK
ncbi:MAG: hypothetical protein HDR12_17450 [Lachnospiraceae bacterium]|nr:hypothetical protein [Lachnospiraceae bacterium]